MPGLIREDTAEKFLPLLDCPSPELAQLTISRIDKVGGAGLRQKVNARILELLGGGDVYSRRLALANAERFDETKRREILEAGLNDESLWVREKAREELRKLAMRKQPPE